MKSSSGEDNEMQGGRGVIRGWGLEGFFGTNFRPSPTCNILFKLAS